VTPRDLPEGLRFEYRFQVASYNGERHDWILVGDAGAINIWAEPSSATSFDGRRWFGGIEGHSKAPAEYQKADKPSQELCWLLLAPCWHDGSSLQFSEEVAPLLPDPSGAPLPEFICQRLMSILQHRYRSWFAQTAGEPS
jgi:hypothetical protein